MDRLRDTVLAEMVQNGRTYGKHEIKAMAAELQLWRAGRDPIKEEEEASPDRTINLKLSVKDIGDLSNYKSLSASLSAGALPVGQPKLVKLQPLIAVSPLYCIIYRVY